MLLREKWVARQTNRLTDGWTDRQTNSQPDKQTGVSPLIICFHHFSGLQLSNGIPSPSCFLVDGVQGVLPKQASCMVNGFEAPTSSHDLSASWAPVAQVVELRPSVLRVVGSAFSHHIHLTDRRTEKQTD